MKAILFKITFLLAAAAIFAVPAFVNAPTMVKEGSTWTVTFQLNEYSDVEVAILDTINGKIVRHLAAGVLGTNPPLPLAPNALTQSLTWDGTDDFGKPVSNPDLLAARIRVGMTPRLTDLVAEDLYSFQGSARSTPSLLFDNTDGTVIMLGQNHGKAYLRKYDASGDYYQTLYPPSSNLAADSVTAYGVNLLGGVAWVPKTTAINGPDGGGAGPIITSSLLNSGATRMISLSGTGQIILVNGMNMSVINKNGAYTNAATQKIITSPAAPTGVSGPWGPQYFTASANPDYLYLSGWFYGTVDGGTWLTGADTTSFWADGQVFRVNKNTGEVTSWLKLDSVPGTIAGRTTKLGWGTNAIAAVHGVTTDDSGHVFVCDRLHKCIGVYDTSANLLGSVPCTFPDFVAVSKRTGAIYVLKRNSGLFTLVKFTGWHDVTTAAASLSLTTSVDGWAGAPVMSLTENNETTNIWVGYGAIGFRLYADQGTSFALIKDFSANANNALLFERPAVNRTTDKLYIPSWNGSTCAISDWSDPRPRSVYPANLDNITIAPNGNIYGFVREYCIWSTPVARFTEDSVLKPLPYGNTGKNAASDSIGYEGGWPGNHRGIAVGWQNNVAAFEEAYHLWSFTDTGYTGTKNAVVDIISTWLGVRWMCNGVKFDPAGNFYIGIALRGSDAIIPSGMASDNTFSVRSGSVVKFAAGTTGTVNTTPKITVTGEAKIYPQPFGPLAGDNSSACNCRNSYFDVDPYGRLFVPNGCLSKIYVADNAGNNIVAFGQYGNTDARGGLAGPGQTYATDDIPMAWPTAVTTSEDYMYITDAINSRLMRVKMEYALNNIPGPTNKAEENSASAGVEASLTPNPFNPNTRLNVTLPARLNVRAAVYSADGRLVREIARGRFEAGTHAFGWNGTDAKGIKATSGLYVFRLTAGTRALTFKAVMAK